MKTTKHLTTFLSALIMALLLSARPTSLSAAEIPEDLLSDEHVREEFGINTFTTPSIEALFGQLDKIGRIPYDQITPLTTRLSSNPPADRSLLGLGLGFLIAEGFLEVHSEHLEKIEPLGKHILNYARALGSGSRIQVHSKSLLEKSVLGDYDGLKDELSKTQADVEAEMVLLRDVDIAHLISLGGWIRALDLALTASLKPSYQAEKAKTIARRDISEYYLATLKTMDPTLLTKEPYTILLQHLEKIHSQLDVPVGKSLSEEELKAVQVETSALLDKLLKSLE